MKLTTLLLFSLFVIQLTAQHRITVIDKNQQNAFLFDEQNPQSLVSLFNANHLPFSPMKTKTAERLNKENLLKDACVVYRMESDIPFSNINGEDSLATINGVLQFVYPPAKPFYTDLSNISRLLLYEHEIGKDEFVIDSVGYGKKYCETKHEVVGSIDFKVLEKEYELFYIEQSTSIEQLMGSGFWSQLKSNQLEENVVPTKPILEWNSLLSDDYYPFAFEMLQQNKARRDWLNNPHFSWPIQSNRNLYLSLSEFEEVFGKGKVNGVMDKESDIPLADINGNDSMIIANGVLMFVYPEPDFRVSWIDVEPTKAWLIYMVSSETTNPTNVLKKIAFTKGDDNILLADFDCTDARVKEFYLDYIKESGIQLEIPVSENWKTALLKAQKTGIKYNLSKKRDLKRLKKEFNQDN